MNKPSFFNTKKVTAGILAVIIFAFILFSSYFLAAEIHHDCSGDHCQTCAVIRLCESILHHFSKGPALFAVGILPLTYLLFLVESFVPFIAEDTLVARKVRLDN